MPFETVVKELTAAGVDPAKAEEIIKDEKIATALQHSLEHGLRQNEFDRKMNLGKAELAAEKQRVAEQAAGLETERTRMTEQFLEAQKQREAADMVLAEALARAKTAEATYGVPLTKEIFGDHTPGPAPTRKPEPVQQPPAVDPALGKRMDDLEGLFQALPELQLEFQDIAVRHAQLFPDKPLDMKAVWSKAKELRQKPTQVWDNLFGATQKEEEIVAERYRLEGEARARTKFEQDASKRAAAPFGVPAAPSPIFAAAANKNTGNDRTRNMAEAVQRATEAMMSGKYASGAARRET